MLNEKYKSLADIWEYSCKEYKDLIAFCDKDCKTTIKYSQAYNMLAFLKKEFLN